MSTAIISPATFRFLRQLSSNNNREWFGAHKAQYEDAKTNAEEFVDALIAKMNVHDQLETSSGKKSLYRIYNDVRFSKDKTPYSPRFAGYLRRMKPFLRGGYYFWVLLIITTSLQAVVLTRSFSLFTNQKRNNNEQDK